MRADKKYKEDYKEGDLVIACGNLNSQVKNGTLGVVIENDGINLGVSFFVEEAPKEASALHNLFGRIPTRTGWWCDYFDVEPYEEAEDLPYSLSLENLW